MYRTIIPPVVLAVLGLGLLGCEDRSQVQDAPGAGQNKVQTNPQTQQSDGVEVQTETDGQGEDGVKVRVRTPKGDFNVDVEY